MEDSPQDPGNVGIDCRLREFVGETGNRAGRVGADPGECAERGDVSWQGAAMVGDDFSRQTVQIGGTAVVSESGPGLLDATARGLGERFDGGKAFQESGPVALDSGHLRLLEHDLGDEDTIRVAGASPRQVPAVTTEPGQQTAFDTLALHSEFEARLGIHQWSR